MQSKDMALAQWASSAAHYSAMPGRSWRSVDDTTLDPIIAARRPKPFPSWSRNEDYYSEGSLVWLDADMLIRTATRSEEHTSELQSLMRISYAVFCLTTKQQTTTITTNNPTN